MELFDFPLAPWKFGNIRLYLTEATLSMINCFDFMRSKTDGNLLLSQVLYLYDVNLMTLKQLNSTRHHVL